MDLGTVRGEDIPVPPSEHSNSNYASCVEPRLTRSGHLSSRLSPLICRLCAQLLGLGKDPARQTSKETTEQATEINKCLFALEMTFITPVKTLPLEQMEQKRKTNT